MGQDNLEMVVLTKSSKFGDYCVAGLDLHDGQWVRLVTANTEKHGAVSSSDIQYKNGSACQVLDLVRVRIKGSSPEEFQPENIIMDTSVYIKNITRWGLQELIGFHAGEIEPYIFGDTKPYLLEKDMVEQGKSLLFVEVQRLVIRQINSNEKTKTKVEFTYQRKQYRNMSVTDSTFYKVEDGTSFDHAYIVVSLPDAPISVSGENRYYKFVAQIFT